MASGSGSETTDLASIDNHWKFPCNHDAAEPPATAYDRITTIKVSEGSTSREFLVYRGVLCFHSELFKRAFNSNFKEGDLDVYEVTDYKIVTFEMFYNWINTGIPTIGLKQMDKYYQALDLYIFTDFYTIPSLKNCAIEAHMCVYLGKRATDLTSIKAIYERTPENSPLRKLLVDIRVDWYSFKTLKTFVAGWGFDFAADIIEASRARSVVPGVGSGDMTRDQWTKRMRGDFCTRYHDHTVLESVDQKDVDADSQMETD
ncbi:hypothetical protein BU23DRAFT_646161 [Bimuria novae-zelandiae CBS 107.79]|uniref:BTB domain-containing protein n=1 Tax=Bimuria novae-zelandiae CBS 107.79 TaxID=1447943 RepID=A0A6A5VEI5_9PLEO|nr:hypothetical protein BU23DRAFT_646161 [Bimuria novae-zelandiae CBS 107.79]